MRSASPYKLWVAALIFLVSAGAVAAQSFLVVEQEKLLAESLYGKEIVRIEADKRQELIDEGRNLDRLFEEEERRLTDLRARTEPEKFREMADFFDAKVITTRREQEEKALDLNAENEEGRRRFLATIGPILLEILNETGASAVVERRSLLIAKQDLNITDEVIKRLDAAFLAERGNSGQENPDNN